MNLYKNKFRIASARLKEWDYSTPSWYYVTICTKNMKHWFGEIKNNEMILNDAGKVVEMEWKRTNNLREQVEIEEFVVMPNHFHGIVIISGSEIRNRENVKTHSEIETVETHRDASLHTVVKNNLSDIIRGFKVACTKQIHSIGYTSFNWQSRFYDHIIRNEKDLLRIRTYIQNNPMKWELDKYYSKE